MIILSTPSSFDTSIICFNAGIRTCEEITYCQYCIQWEFKIYSGYLKQKGRRSQKTGIATFSINLFYRRDSLANIVRALLLQNQWHFNLEKMVH